MSDEEKEDKILASAATAKILPLALLNCPCSATPCSDPSPKPLLFPLYLLQCSLDEPVALVQSLQPFVMVAPKHMMAVWILCCRMGFVPAGHKVHHCRR